MSSVAAPIVLILGVGSNVGSSIAKRFISEGYKVAAVSRSLKDSQAHDTSRVDFSADLSSPQAVADVFKRVKTSVGTPEVVIYNAAAASQAPKDDPLALSLTDFKKDLELNTVSVFAAAQEAVKAFGEIPESASRTFIYTGNVLNTTILPGFISLGVGKSATAHIIHSAAAAYAPKGYKFYYCDERKANGAPAFLDIDGDAHAEMYLSLAQSQTQGEWFQTFVKGVGYKKF